MITNGIYDAQAYIGTRIIQLILAEGKKETKKKEKK